MVDAGIVAGSGLATTIGVPIAATIGVPAFVVLLILREVFNFLKGRKVNNKTDSNAQCALSAERATQIMDKLKSVEILTRENHEIAEKTFEMHNIKDSDGVYSWYVPRSWSDTQKDIVTILQNISVSQEIIAATLERLERKGDNN